MYRGADKWLWWHLYGDRQGSPPTEYISQMKKLFKKLHRFCGLTAGLIIFISCLTGAILVFTDEVRELLAPERYFHPKYEGQQRLALTDIMQRVQAELPERPIQQIEIHSDTTRNYIIGYGGKDKTQIFVDPYTGRVVEVFDRGKDDFFATMVKAHRWLMDESKSWGKAITGASTLIFVLVLISGIVYWLPKDRHTLRQRLRVKTNASTQRLLRDTHASLGIYAVSALLVMALTGLTWSYPWYRSGLYALLGVEVASKKEQPTQAKPKDKPISSAQEAIECAGIVPYFDWDNAYRAVRTDYGAYRYIRLEEGKAKVRDTNVWGNIRREDSYKLDAVTGAIKGFSPYAEADAESRARGWIYSLHAGLWGGLFSKVLYFLACVLGASFPLTGLWLYISVYKTNKKVSRR